MGDERHRLRRITTVDAPDDVQNHAGLGVACYQRLHFETELFELPYNGVGHLRRRQGPGGVGSLAIALTWIMVRSAENTWAG